MIEKTINTIKRFGLAAPGDKILVGVSGGPDSVALLLGLSQLAPRLGVSLIAAHLNHGLRGREADRDEDFVRDLARRLKISVVTKKINLKPRLPNGSGSIEETARKERYAFLVSVAGRKECRKVAVGHILDDNAETVVMNLVRGSGVKGLGGIPPHRALNDKIELIRPLIEVSREEVLKFLKENHQSYRTDSTNTDTIFRRNKIRHELIPLLKGDYNPRIVETLSDTAAVMRSADEYLESEVRRLLASVVRARSGCFAIKQRLIKSMHPFMRKEIIRRLVKENFGINIELHRLDEVNNFIETSRAGTIHVSDSVKITKEYSDMVVRKAEPVEEDFVKRLRVPGKIMLGFFGTQLNLELVEHELSGTGPGHVDVSFPEVWEKIRNGNQVILEEVFDADKFDHEQVMVRNRRRGDKYRPIGFGHSKSIKTIMIDEKIPVSLRSKIPLLINGDEIVWLIGYRINENYKITRETRTVLKVQAKIFYCTDTG